jgi:hypothetical protein
MAIRDVISGLFLILLSLGACIMAYRLGLGTGSNPGAGFAAFGIAFLMGLMALGLFFKALIQVLRRRGHDDGAEAIEWKKPALGLLVLTAYGVFFGFLGFPLSTFLLMMILVWGLGRRRLAGSLAVSVLTAAASYALFVTALGLPLPSGSLWQLFGD